MDNKLCRIEHLLDTLLEQYIKAEWTLFDKVHWACDYSWSGDDPEFPPLPLEKWEKEILSILIREYWEYTENNPNP